jgi:hypothetical protein
LWHERDIGMWHGGDEHGYPVVSWRSQYLFDCPETDALRAPPSGVLVLQYLVCTNTSECDWLACDPMRRHMSFVGCFWLHFD